MSQYAKTKNVAKNTLMGITNNVVLVGMGLISRRLFLQYIGIEFLSVGQVINNMLAILAFSELGVSNSITFMLYKPVVEKDKEEISRIIGTYKTLNRLIGSVIFLLGLCFIPFLGRIVNTSVPMDTVYMVFIMNLFVTAGTYFCSYRNVLLNADQKSYVVSKVALFTNICSSILQCAVIFLTHNYIVYLAVQLIFAIVSNIIVYYVSGKMYPYLGKFCGYRLNKQGTRELAKNVKAMFSVRICGIVINNTDNILVSSINTLMVGYCANYLFVTQKFQQIITIFQNSIMYSLGNASVESEQLGKYRLFWKITMINVFIGGFTAVLCGVLWDDFIILWLGEEYLLPKIVVYAIMLEYARNIIFATVWMFRDTNGLFVYTQKVLITNAVLNLIISILLGKLIGVAGVYFATTVSFYLTSFWHNSRLIYKSVFGRKDYWKYCIFVSINFISIVPLVHVLSILMSSWNVSIINWIIKAMIVAIVYIIIFLSLYSRTEPMKDLIFNMVMPWTRSKLHGLRKK